MAPRRWPGPLWWLTRAHTGCLRIHIPRRGHLTHPIPPAANPHRLLPRSLHALCFSSPYLCFVLPESFLRRRHSACRGSCGSSTTSRRGRGGGFSHCLFAALLCPLCPGLCHRRLRTGATGLGWGHLQGSNSATTCVPWARVISLWSPVGLSPSHHVQLHIPWGSSSRCFQLLISGCNHCRLDFTVLRLRHRCQLRTTLDRDIYSRQCNPFVSGCAGLSEPSSVTPRREAHITRCGDTCSVNGRGNDRDCDPQQPQTWKHPC